MGFEYPKIRRVDVKDDYHGIIVEDPYRYMEDPSDPDAVKFVEENNIIAMNYIDKEKLAHFSKKMDINTNYTKYSIPFERNGKYFFWKQKPDQKQVIYYMRDGLNGQDTEILDVNTLSEDGTTSVISFFVSPDTKYFVATVSVFGSDWLYFLIKEIATGKVIERLDWMTITDITWEPDSSGFYYPRFPDQTTVSDEDRRKFAKLYFHKLGTPQSGDELVYDPEDKMQNPDAVSTIEDQKYLFLTVSLSTLPENRLLYRKKTEKSFTALVDEYDGCNYYPIGLLGNTMYLRTSWNAPNQRIMEVDMNNPAKDQWREIIGNSEHLLEYATIGNSQLITVYQEHVKHKIRIFNLDGNMLHEVDLPGTGAIDSNNQFEAALWCKDDGEEIFFGFTNFLYPITVFRYDFKTNEVSEFFESQLKINADNYEVKQVFYPSKDGTKIPMYIVHKKGLELNGKNPTFLYGYGGFDSSKMPEFLPVHFTWIDEGYVFAQTNLRGGGEYGKKWHEQALLGNKQNVFDDFIAAAEWLIANNYTSTPYLAINGRSNGGLLVGACITQRPDLFGAAIPTVGVLDMLRYPIQPDAGHYWTGEYGDAINNKEHFEFLIKFSPYHNVKETSYPPTLITAAEHDDRVAPMHSKKFGAALQHANKGDNPILVRIETKAGHGFGKPRQKLIEDYAINLAFIATVMKL